MLTKYKQPEDLDDDCPGGTLAVNIPPRNEANRRPVVLEQPVDLYNPETLEDFVEKNRRLTDVFVEPDPKDPYR